MINITDYEPMIELINPVTGVHIKVWPNGKCEGFDGTIINRTPQVLNAIVEQISNGVIGFGQDIKNLTDIWK